MTFFSSFCRKKKELKARTQRYFKGYGLMPSLNYENEPFRCCCAVEMTHLYLKSVKVHSRQRVGYSTTNTSFHICPQRAKRISAMYLCIKLFLTPRVAVYFCAFVCVVVNALSVRGTANPPGRCCLYKHRMWWRSAGEPGGEVGRHGPAPAHAHRHTATEAGSSKS